MPVTLSFEFMEEKDDKAFSSLPTPLLDAMQCSLLSQHEETVAVGSPGHQGRGTLPMSYAACQVCSTHRTPDFTRSILREKSLKVHKPIFTVKNKTSPGMRWPV